MVEIPFADDGVQAQKEPDTYFGKEETDDRSKYQDIMRYPIYYDNAVDNDETQGKVVLADVLSAPVTWTTNQIPSMQFTYPRDGVGAKLIKHEGIIMYDVNRYLTHQKFRVKKITKSETNIVIDCTHIIGDLAGITLKKSIQLPDVNSSQLFDALIENSTSYIPDLRYDSDISTVSNVNIDMTNGNLSNYVFDTDQEGDTATQSLLGLYGGELTADNYHLIHNKRMGRDTGIVIRYGDKIQTIQQDDSIENTYTCIYPYAKYTPGQAVATETNTDWSVYNQDWTSVGSVTYSAGGSIDIYSSPVEGHQVVGHVTTGMHLKLGTPVTNGSFTKDGKFQINTVNGDTWYPISTESGGGWIDAQWINFSKSGDYLVNNVTGHVHTVIKDTDVKTTRYPVAGTGTVNCNGGIRVFYSPDPGPDQRPTGRRLKNGQRFSYDEVAIIETDSKWYRLGSHQWVYGPHVKVDSEQDITRYPSRGQGYIKQGSVAYHIDKNHQMTPKTHPGKLVSTRKKKTPKTKIVYRGKGKKRHKVKEKTYYYGKTTKYHKQEKSKLPRGMYKLNYGQVSVGGTIYYKVGNNTYVKASSIDWKNKYSKQPKKPSEYVKNTATKKGWIDVYSQPTSRSSANWTVPVGTAFAISHSATDGAGTTWYEITYNDHGTEKTGWITSDVTDSSAADDLEPTSSDNDSDSEGQATTVDQTEVMVTLDDDNGLVFPEDGGTHEVQRVLNVDLSAYIKHDDQDLSGQQPDGTFVATADDKRQLLEAAQAYVVEHNVGHPAVTLTLTTPQFDDVDGDITTLNMYDRVTVIFEQLGIKETAEVTSTIYDPISQHYTQITIGDLPKTWQHLLVEAANKNTNELSKRVGGAVAHSDHIFGRMKKALSEEGSDRLAAERDIMKEVGLVNDKADKMGNDLEVSLKTFDNQMQAINSDVTSISDQINSGGTDVIHFVPNTLNPTEIQCKTPYGYFRLNSNGLGYMGNDGVARVGMTAQGQLAAENLDASTINALTIKSCVIKSALKLDQGQTHISIGTEGSPYAQDFPLDGGNAIWLDGGSNHALYSYGRIVIRNGSKSIIISPDGIYWNGQKLHNTITVKGTQYNLWY